MGSGSNASFEHDPSEGSLPNGSGSGHISISSDASEMGSSSPPPSGSRSRQAGAASVVTHAGISLLCSSLAVGLRRPPHFRAARGIGRDVSILGTPPYSLPNVHEGSPYCMLPLPDLPPLRRLLRTPSGVQDPPTSVEITPRGSAADALADLIPPDILVNTNQAHDLMAWTAGSDDQRPNGLDPSPITRMQMLLNSDTIKANSCSNRRMRGRAAKAVGFVRRSCRLSGKYADTALVKAANLKAVRFGSTVERMEENPLDNNLGIGILGSAMIDMGISLNPALLQKIDDLGFEMSGADTSVARALALVSV
ncbi:hypothetical protein Cni_G22079 [Canna indica]|uniref:Uncharacterized protein n=1 Tax=Canna indica TaxID=4628 RepID=A0AAQ3KRV4_9LILI|nr:hypothetical protein Cni_G22079 [Canna indica]